MRRFTLFFSIPVIIGMMATAAVKAQTVVSTFNDLVLPGVDTYFVSYSDTGFNDGMAHFPCIFDTTGGYLLWSYFTYSNMTDSVTSGVGNQFSAKTAIGYGGSANYAVASCFNPFTYANTVSVNLLERAGVSQSVAGFYVTNSTYAYNSMRDGDMFARKFHNGDWFKLTIYGYSGGSISDSVSTYLADFLFPDSTMNYILNTWQWVNLLPLGNVDSLLFSLSSTDNSIYGMNTPAYFCMDNFTVNESTLGVKNVPEPVAKVYPNPAINLLYVDIMDNTAQQIQVMDIAGNMIASYPVTSSHTEINIESLPAGVYLLTINGAGKTGSIKFVKQ